MYGIKPSSLQHTATANFYLLRSSPWCNTYSSCLGCRQERPQDFFQGVIGGRRGQRLGSAEHEPITGVWGQSPQWGPRTEPLVRGSGGQSPPEAESILVIGCPTEPANLAPFQKCICISTLGANGNDTGKILCRNPGVRCPLAPSWGRPCWQSWSCCGRPILFVANWKDFCTNLPTDTA